MAANGEVIKSFLVGLGFDVDESSLAAFNKNIQIAAARVTALYGAVNAFAGSMVFAFAKISEGFEEMGYQYHIIAPAINKAIVLRQELLKAYSAAGINIRKVIVDSIKLNMSLAKTKFAMEAIYKSVGSRFFGLLQKQSDAFRKKLYENMPYIINALEKLVKTVFYAFDLVTQLGSRLWSILSRVYGFFVKLDEATNGWSTKIGLAIAAWKLLNLKFMTSPLGIILSIGAALLALYDDYQTWKEGGQSMIDWGSKTVQTIEKIAAAVGGVAVSIYAIYKTAQGLSTLYSVYKDVKAVFTAVYDFYKTVRAAGSIMEGIALFAEANPFTLIATAIIVAIIAIGLLIWKWKEFKQSMVDAYDWLKEHGKFLSNFLNPGAAFETSGAPGPKTTPIDLDTFNRQMAQMNAGPQLGTSPSGTNVNANMQTSVIVQGSPNADATARAVGAQQTNVNRDMVRNMKGGIR